MERPCQNHPVRARARTSTCGTWSVGLLVIAASSLSGCGVLDKSCGSNAFSSDYPSAPAFVGLSEDDARAKAAQLKVRFRVMCRDGKNPSGAADADLDFTRVNVGVDDGEVTSARRF
jgi:hypothetical protein